MPGGGSNPRQSHRPQFTRSSPRERSEGGNSTHAPRSTPAAGLQAGREFPVTMIVIILIEKDEVKSPVPRRRIRRGFIRFD